MPIEAARRALARRPGRREERGYRKQGPLEAGTSPRPGLSSIFLPRRILTVAFAITTSRLQLRWLTAADADFVLQLVNDADWLRFIGDRGVHDIDAARRYIETGPAAMYREFGFGLNRVALARGDRAIGICGLLQRATLDHPDLGFALLPAFRARGYALEAARAVLEHARETLAIERVLAIVNADNTDSVSLLTRLGFTRAGEHVAEADSRLLDLYAIDLRASGGAA